jgi:hypothetical protein
MAEKPESVPAEPDHAEAVKTTRCPSCNYDNRLDAVTCANENCKLYLKSELECLRAIDDSLRTIKRIAIWWVILFILGFVAALLYFLVAAAGGHR